MICLLWTASTPLFSSFLRYQLESEFLPVSLASTPNADAIVVLGGAVSGPAAPFYRIDFGASADRIIHGVRLYKAGKAPTIIAVGGDGSIHSVVEPESETMLTIFTELGVPRSAIFTETQSRNTRENALFARKIIERHRFRQVLLVTSALHMPRALKCFERVGIDVVAATTDYTAKRHSSALINWLPAAEPLSLTTDAIKELLGMWYYKLRGWV